MVNSKSNAKIADRPVHSMLIAFSVAFFIATFSCDLVYWANGYDAWATAAAWLLGTGIVLAALAGVAGLSRLLGGRSRRARDYARWPPGGAAVCVALHTF